MMSCLIADWTRKRGREVYWEVRHSNYTTRDLYLKFGFKIVGVKKNYYAKNKEDAILMSLSLPEVTGL